MRLVALNARRRTGRIYFCESFVVMGIGRVSSVCGKQLWSEKADAECTDGGGYQGRQNGENQNLSRPTKAGS